MSLEQTEELRMHFRLASLHKEAQSLKSPEDWRGYVQIAEKHQKAREAAKHNFQDGFDERMSKARQKAIRDAGANNYDHPAPIGIDKFNPNLINRRAESTVRRDHQRAIARIDKSEMQDLEKHMEQARTRDRPTQAFERARDQRPEPEHHRQPQPQRS